MNTARQSILRKLRIYSNEVVRITEQLDTEEIEIDEAEKLLIALDERIADRILDMDVMKDKISN